MFRQERDPGLFKKSDWKKMDRQELREYELCEFNAFITPDLETYFLIPFFKGNPPEIYRLVEVLPLERHR